MSQVKQMSSVTSGSAAVVIPGINLTARIKQNSIFMVNGVLTPYTVAANSTFDGANTNVVLTGNYVGATNAAAPGVFVTDFTYPDNLPLISQGDVGTAAIYSASMYALQAMMAAASPAGFVANAANVATVTAAVATIAADLAAVNTAAAAVATASTSVAASVTTVAGSATSAAASATSATTSATSATASAAALATALASFNSRWLGSQATNPTLDLNGVAVAIGAEYWNSTNSILMIYTSTGWQANDAAAVAQNAAATLSATAAAASASGAASSATTATTDATNAAASATTATIQAGIASTGATNAAASAAAAAVSAAAILSTSTTSLTPTMVTQTFATQAGKQYAPGQFVTASSAANPANFMFGQVSSYSGTLLAVNVTAIGGTGAHADWNISISGAQGVQGAPGSGSGSVTSVGLTMPADFVVASTPITVSGTLGVTYASQTAAHVHAGPTTGGPATPTWRQLAATDIPLLNQNTTGSAGSAGSVAVSGVTGLGTGVATALAINTGTAGSHVVLGGAGGTPSSMVGTNISGTAAGLSIGGSAVSSTTQAAGDNTTAIATDAFVQTAVNGLQSIPITSAAQVLTASQAAAQIIIYTGALTANTTVAVPAAGKTFTVINRTTGAYALTQIAVGGTGIVVTQGKAQELTCDGTNVLLASNDLAGAGIMAAVAPGTIGNQLTNVAGAWASVAPASADPVWTYTNGATNAVAGGHYDIDTSAAPVTLTLPAGMTANQTVSWRDYLGTFATNNATIANNGNKINGVVANLTSDINNETRQLTFTDATVGCLIS